MFDLQQASPEALLLWGDILLLLSILFPALSAVQIPLSVQLQARQQELQDGDRIKEEMSALQVSELLEVRNEDQLGFV